MFRATCSGDAEPSHLARWSRRVRRQARGEARALAHAPRPLPTRRAVSGPRWPRPKSTARETAPPAAPARGAGGAGRGAARVPAGPSRPPIGHARCETRLPINAFIGPGTFMSRCASLRGGTPLASGHSLRSAFNRTEGSVKPPEACGARPARARAAKGLARRANQGRVRLRAQACSVHAPHARAPRKATWLKAAAFGRGGKALAVRMRGFLSVVCARSLARRARPPRGHAPASAGPGAARAVPARGIEDAQEREPQMPRAEVAHGT